MHNLAPLGERRRMGWQADEIINPLMGYDITIITYQHSTEKKENGLYRYNNIEL